MSEFYFLSCKAWEEQVAKKSREQELEGDDFNDCDRDSASDDSSDDDEDDGMEAANEEMIENLMRIPFNENSTERVYAICFVEFSLGEEVIYMHCSHIFHEECVVTWLRRDNSCPMCRSQILD
ncbi:hypothetical protein ACFE04_030049 [Oxalis oulophora]